MHTFSYIISIFDSLTCVLRVQVNISLYIYSSRIIYFRKLVQTHDQRDEIHPT